jgi:hypothetical protein
MKMVGLAALDPPYILDPPRIFERERNVMVQWLSQLMVRSTMLAIVAALATSAECLAAEKPAKQVKIEAVNRAFAAFVKEPTKENFLRAFQQTTTAENYEPYSTELDDVKELAEGHKFVEAQARLKKAMPGLLLSPQAHFLASRVARGLGDATTAEKETSLGKKCLEGILGTGNGSAEKPYLVTRVSDEYDVLRQLKKFSAQQAVLHKNGKVLDLIQCNDGIELWFDVTAAFTSMTAGFKSMKDERSKSDR